MLLRCVILYVYMTVNVCSCEDLNPANYDNNDENPLNLFHNNKPTIKLDIDVNDDQNPFDLFKKKKQNLISENDGNDDQNPFNLFKKTNRTIISVEDQKIDIFLHVHLVKVIWNKINLDINTQKLMDSKKYPISVDFKFHLTEEMFANMQDYNNVSDQQFGININHHFMNYLEIVNEKKTFGNDTMEAREAWYETKMFVVSVVACVVMSFLLMSKMKFVLLVLVAGFVHKGWEMYDDGEIKRRFMMSAEISKKCYPVTNLSYWDKIKGFFRSDVTLQCLEFERDVHIKSLHNANVFKIASAIVSDCLFGVFNSVGKLVGTTYTDMSKQLPWGLAPIFTLFIIFMALAFVAVVIIKTCSLWLTRSAHHECNIDHSCSHKIQDTRHKRSGSASKHAISYKPSSFSKRGPRWISK